jgi:hypothetical protein
MLAAAVPWRRGTLAAVILAGCAVDFSCGVLLHAHVEGLENSAQSTVFPGMVFVGGSIQAAPAGPDGLSLSAWNNWFAKHQVVLYYRWLNELDRQYGRDPEFQQARQGYVQTVQKMLADDANRWQGWFVHHGGEVVFLGDYAAAWSAAAQVLLVALFLGLAGGAWRKAG